MIRMLKLSVPGFIHGSAVESPAQFFFTTTALTERKNIPTMVFQLIHY
jgi:hypothetical protein